MARRRRSLASRFFNPALGVVLAPAAALCLLAALGALWDAAGARQASAWFTAGFLGYGGLYSFGFLRLRRAYVLAHEMTHAAAAWMMGEKVLGLSVGKESGHVDLSRSNLFISLAPYWVPFYAFAAVLAFRLAFGESAPPAAKQAFLLVMGAAMAFHLLHTVESLWTARQSDLDHAGPALSLSLIGLLNGLLLLAALKSLFPSTVSVSGSLHWAWRASSSAWTSLLRAVT
ncbi:MAG: hypothetical protein AAB412_01790 [Elusimicrobiota bacterium]